MKLVIIADDLTGALDAAAVFAAAGMRAVVAVVPECFERAMLSGADVIAVSLNSREGSSHQAVQKAKAAAALIPPGSSVFIKIDSRLKGHVRAELDAISAVMSATHVTVCSAIPAMGRIVKHGLLQGFGISDPINCRAVILQGFERPVVNLKIPDAQNETDLDNIVSSAPHGSILCGARGLAAALARKLSQTQTKPNVYKLPLPQPILFAIGSRDPITLEQVDALRSNVSNCAYCAAPNGVVTQSVLPSGNLIIQCVTDGRPTDASSVTASFADAIAFRAAHRRASLVLTGGETAAAVLARLGIGILEIVGEPVSGIPVSIPLGSNGTPVIVTKSGGFGEDDALLKLIASKRK